MSPRRSQSSGSLYRHHRRRAWRADAWLWNQRPRIKLACLVIGGVLAVFGVHVALAPAGSVSASVEELNGFVRWFNTDGRFRNFPAFALLAFFLFAGLRARHTPRTAYVLGLVAFCVEVLQVFVPSRTVDVWDILFSWLGIAAAWAAVWLCRNGLAPWKERMKETVLRRAEREATLPRPPEGSR